MDEFIKQLQKAMSLQGINADPQTTYRIILTHDKVKEVGGNFTITHAEEIEKAALEKYAVVTEVPIPDEV